MTHTYQVKIKERGSKHVLTPSITRHHKEMSRQEIIDFFGLNEPDVEWFEITEL